jgi:hypothetical protein
MVSVKFVVRFPAFGAAGFDFVSHSFFMNPVALSHCATSDTDTARTHSNVTDPLTAFMTFGSLSK